MALGFGKRVSRETGLEGVNLLGLTPRRAAEWEEVEGRVILLRPASAIGGIRGVLDRFLHRMSAQRIRLDEMGSFAWLHLDGNRTVSEVGELMRSEFGGPVEPVEERLGHLVRVMREEGFLRYREWDGTDEGFGETRAGLIP